MESIILRFVSTDLNSPKFTNEGAIFPRDWHDTFRCYIASIALKQVTAYVLRINSLRPAQQAINVYHCHSAVFYLHYYAVSQRSHGLVYALTHFHCQRSQEDASPNGMETD